MGLLRLSFVMNVLIARLHPIYDDLKESVERGSYLLQIVVNDVDLLGLNHADQSVRQCIPKQLHLTRC